MRFINSPRLIVKDTLMPSVIPQGNSLTVADAKLPDIIADKWGLSMATDYQSGEMSSRQKSGWGRMDPSVRMDNGRGRAVCKTPQCRYADRHCVSVTHGR